VGARTDAALEEVLAARTSLAEETDRLKVSARNAVDIKAKVKKSPAKAAGVAAGAAFVVAGGPKRVFRAVKRRVRGEPAPLPPSLLPDQIDRAVRALGDDGDKVRGAIERGFADYLDASAPARRKAARKNSVRTMVMKAATPLVAKAARQAFDEYVGTGGSGKAKPGVE
jgi:hypothetical protein